MEKNVVGQIRDTKLVDALSERYLAYALSTIMARSLPDVRDGLKPVHRRLLYAMQQLKLDPRSGFKKCARVVGDVIGKFHPHGDASVYEALVRLAQEFAVRYPLVEGQGNFGSVDGDNAAAMRYTEARLTEVAQALLEGLDDDAVDFNPTYDNEDHEPIVLPGNFPNLLANGAAGIAVGMATNIPPHNAAEICQAARYLLENPGATTADLLKWIPGPDFPTGGILVSDTDSIEQAYATGRGVFRLRASWHVEQGRFGAWNIVVDQIPYQVQKSRLIEQIAELLEQKRLPLLADIRDESTTEIRILLEPKSRSCDPALLMETLFNLSNFESRFNLNMNVLGPDRVPKVMSLAEVVRAWTDHRHVVLVRRSRHRLEAVRKRLEILDGFLAVYLNLDEVIRIIREVDAPKPALMAAFTLNEIQAEYVLNMRLRSLRRLEEMAIRKEREQLLKEDASLQSLLSSDKRRMARLSSELQIIEKKFASGPLGARRTQIAQPPEPLDLSSEALIEREPLSVLLSREGWVRALKGHDIEPESQRFKEGDAWGLAVTCESTDRLCLIASDGRAFTIRAADLPRGRGFGQPIRVLLDLAPQADVVTFFVVKASARYLLATKMGKGLIASGANLFAEKRTGKQIVILSAEDHVAFCLPIDGDHVACLGDNRRVLVFPVDQIAEMSRGKGVTLQNLPDARLRDVRIFSLEEGLIWEEGQRKRARQDLVGYFGRRGAVGKPAPIWMRRREKP